jgi:hypothetical protein
MFIQNQRSNRHFHSAAARESTAFKDAADAFINVLDHDFD